MEQVASEDGFNFSFEEKWVAASALFEEYGLVRQHLDSFNDFVSRGLKQIVSENPEIRPEISNPNQQNFYVKLRDITVGEPSIREADGSETRIYPMEARIRNLTYAGKLTLHVTIVKLDADGKEYDTVNEEVFIGHLPIMLRSNKCLLHKRLEVNPDDPEALLNLKEDHRDPGGYFIINGTERVVVTQEDLAHNRIMVEKEENPTSVLSRAKVFSTNKGFRASVSIEMNREQKLRVNFPSMPRKIPLLIMLRALGISTDREIAELFGNNPQSEKIIFTMLEADPDIQTIENALDYIGKRVAVGQTKEYRIQRAGQVVDRYLLPHLGLEPVDRCKKAYYLSMMANRLLELNDTKDGVTRKEDDKDHYANKRFKLAGELILNLFRTSFATLVKDMTYQLERNTGKGKKISVKTTPRADMISDRLRHSLATGNWIGGKSGVSQLLDRTNHMSTLSHLRRVLSPLSRSQPHYEARDLHPTHFGKICPAETPEGPNCGLVKNLALQAFISVGVDEHRVEDLLYDTNCVIELGVSKDTESSGMVIKRDGDPDDTIANVIRPCETETMIGANAISDSVRVFLNGRLIGITDRPLEFYEELLKSRRNGKKGMRISPEVNFTYYPDVSEFQINCDGGRVRRALIICDDNVPRLKEEHIRKLRAKEWGWNDLVERAIVEVVDTEEEEGLLIAITSDVLKAQREKNQQLNYDPAAGNSIVPNNILNGGIFVEGDTDPIFYSHLEIAPATILGICGSMTPFPEHNRSDRNVYEASMAKQALGVFALNYKYRMDTRAHILYYPQKPLVKTHGMDTMDFDDRPAGQNFIIAIMSWGGYNMEDAIIINKSSVDRGLGRSTFFRAHEAEERVYPGGLEDRFEIPNPDVRGYRSPEVYRHLSEEDGIIEPETEVDGSRGDTIIGKTSPPRFMEEYSDFDIYEVKRRDTSKNIRHGEKGIADTVMLTETQDGNKLVKVKVRSVRIPEIGDKFASRHGQKGVLSLLLPQEDMPVNEKGITPDIIVNPHGIPSRMTVGQLLEIVASKVGALQGIQLYGTAFDSVSFSELKDMLMESGSEQNGYEVLYDGRTGKRIRSNIFMGIAFYQKLHHLVNDKIHARARGPVQMLTRQPTEGRAREGGLRFGEMERDCLIGHGTAIVLKERLLDESDKTIVYFCEECGYLGFYDRFKDIYRCTLCKKENTVSRVAVSYAFKLLLQELLSLGLSPQVVLKDIA